MALSENPIYLWQDVIPGEARVGGEERYEDERVYNVRRPALMPYLPPADIANGAVVIVFPGGAYKRLSLVKEGVEIAEWLNSLGVAAFVLKYRMQEFGHPAPMADGLRAVQLVRKRAAEFNLDPARIGVLGFSAGGHLAATVATHFAQANIYAGDDLFAGISARPDFTILLYPVITFEGPYAHAGSREALLGPKPKKKWLRFYSLEQQVTADTPPAFLMHGSDDESVLVENSLLYYQALRRAGVPAELLVYQHAPHGFGMRAIDGATTIGGPALGWPQRCAEWLRFNGLLNRSPRPD